MTIADENTKIIITLPKKVKRKIMEQAEYEGKTLSNMAYYIIIQYCKEKANLVNTKVEPLYYKF